MVFTAVFLQAGAVGAAPGSPGTSRSAVPSFGLPCSSAQTAVEPTESNFFLEPRRAEKMLLHKSVHARAISAGILTHPLLLRLLSESARMSRSVVAKASRTAILIFSSRLAGCTALCLDFSSKKCQERFSFCDGVVLRHEPESVYYEPILGLFPALERLVFPT